jgi:hypothetical protein
MRARGVDHDQRVLVQTHGTKPPTTRIKSVEAGSSNSSSSSGSPTDKTISSAKPGCMAATPQVQELMRRFAQHAYTSYMQGTPALSHLALLVKYNVSSALQRNADIRGVKAEYFECEGLSPLAKQGNISDPLSPFQSKDWPVSLLPTKLQRSMEHHPWIDVFPWPRFRDNMLQGFQDPDICDEDELCREVVEYEDHNSKPLLIVWGDAWNPWSWEVTPEFLRKWGWLLSGCDDFLESTNYWRARRNERSMSRREVLDAIQTSMPERLRRMPGL